MAFPLYRWLLGVFRDRKALSSVATILIVFLVLVVPLTFFLGIVVSQAVSISQAVQPEVERLLDEPTTLDEVIAQVPYVEKDWVITKLGEVTQGVGQFLIQRLAAATAGTALFLFNLFIMLYAMFFFLVYGRPVLDRMLYYLPLSNDDKDRMLEKFISVSRATVKGTLVIGIVQGGLAGLAFAVVGIKGAVFWGTVMMVLSIIPAVGAALVWIPAVGYLLATGQVGAGHRPGGVVRRRRRHRRQLSPPAAHRAGYEDARPAGAARHARRPIALRGCGRDHRPHRGGAVSHHLGHLRHGL